MLEHYKLVDGEVVECSIDEWAAFIGSPDKIIAKTEMCTKYGDEVEVSTVFLGIDHSFGGARPLLFETMVFGLRPRATATFPDGSTVTVTQDNETHEYMRRYSTLDEAKMGHARAIEEAESGTIYQ